MQLLVKLHFLFTYIVFKTIFSSKNKIIFTFYQPGYRSAKGGKESPDSKGQHTG
jgi:hypothetical protein